MPARQFDICCFSCDLINARHYMTFSFIYIIRTIFITSFLRLQHFTATIVYTHPLEIRRNCLGILFLRAKKLKLANLFVIGVLCFVCL